MKHNVSVPRLQNCAIEILLSWHASKSVLIKSVMESYNHNTTPDTISNRQRRVQNAAKDFLYSF